MLGALAALSCGEPHASSEVLTLRGSADAADRWRFADGLRVWGVSAPAEPLVPGTQFSIEFEVSAPGRFEVSVVPPRAGAREVARGGPDAPPVVVPRDARTVTRTVEGQGRVAVTLELPQPWHPKTAIVLLRRQGPLAALPAVQGPRRRDGVAVLGVLDVSTRPTHVVAVSASPQPDGVLDDAVWQSAPRYALVDSIGGEPVRLGARREDDADWGRTEVAFAYDDKYLYAAAWLPDRDLRGTFTDRDDPIWKEEVFELFVFGDARRADYLELQVSPRGVRFDAKFERYRKGDEAWNSGFVAAVAVGGSIEAPGDRDEGWSAELAVPWSEICEFTEVRCPVGPGTSLRINAFRLERPRNGPAVGLALSPTRVPDFHAPENSAQLELLP